MSSINLITVFVFVCTTLHGHIATSQAHNNDTQSHTLNTILCSDETNNNESISLCDCELEKNGKRFEVTCSRRHITNELFATAKIPEKTKILQLSWNDLENIPKINSKQLTILDLSNNHLSKVTNQIFTELSVLIELDLSHNHITTIETNAFDSLTSLKRLDLSYNKLKLFNENIFKPLISLEALALSNNRQLNETLGKTDVGLFTTLGVPNTLSWIELNDLGLSSLNLQNGNGLKEIYLRYNRFTTVPKSLPIGVELIDFSGNSFVEIDEHFLPFENSLRELHLSQMSTLTTIRPYAFHNLTRLQALNLDGCRYLKSFFPNAFDRLSSPNGSTFAAPFLDRINLRNAKLQMFNLGDAAKHLQWERIDLHGNPLICDCRLSWIRELPIDTYARCAQPAELKDSLVTNISKKKFVCRFWPNFVYAMLHSVLVLCILIIGAIPIWLLIILVKPSRRARLQKIGSSSPYAPITIETNRAEDYY